MLINIQPIVERRNELTGKGLASEAIVLSSRIRLARNLEGRRFPDWANKSQREDILTACEAAIAALPEMQDGMILATEKLDELEKQVLVERHLISRELSRQSSGSGVAISQDQSCAIMINEEDHLRLQLLRRGFCFQDIWDSMSSIDDRLEQSLDFAYSTQRGFLTACPTNLGTGLRASVMMHLPGLVIAGHMEKVIRFANQLNLAVRGIFGEGSDATGSIFQISNQQTLGESEATIITKLTGVLKTVVEQEQNARLKILEDKRTYLLDKVGRAFGLLQNAHMMTSSEAMNHLSLLRLAADLSMLPESERVRADRLFIEVQPGHVQVLARRLLESTERDAQRAELLRKEFRDVPHPDFDISRKRD